VGAFSPAELPIGEATSLPCANHILNAEA
jgi:hypothetical protein